MADEKVSVLIKFDAKTRQLDAAIAKMSLLNKYEKRFASGQSLERFASRGSSAAEKLSKKWKQSFDVIDGAVKMTGKFLTGFLKTAIKGVIGQMALFGASMIAVHATFAAGQFAMKAYRGAMQVFAGGAAAATMAIAAFSAAMREQQAAMFAYRGKGAKEFGSGMNQTRMGMRNLQADASLAVLGIEALNNAYGTMSKSMNVPQINASTSSIRALMDFGSAGQDPSKGLAQVAVVVASLSDKKKNISDVITEAKKLGPEMQEALKKANVKTKDEFSKLLMSGDLAKKGGVEGQFAAVNNTLIGQLKKYFTLLRTEFSDFGDQFLEPLKVAFRKVFDVIKTDLARITAAISSTIGTQGVIDSMVSAIEKTSNFFVKMIRQYLPSAIGIFDRIGGWMENFKRGWNIVLDRLRPLISGAKVLYSALSPIWDAIKEGVSEIYNFNDQLTGNGANFKEFGTNVASIITSISGALSNMRAIFESISPFINDVLKGFGDVFKQVSSFLTGGAGKGFLMALAPLIAMQTLGSKMGATTGRLSPVAGAFSRQVTIQAQNATIVAAGMRGPAGAYSGVGVSAASSVPLSARRQNPDGTFSSGATGSASATTGSAELKKAAETGQSYARSFAAKGDPKSPGEAIRGNTQQILRHKDLTNVPYPTLGRYLKESANFRRSSYGAANAEQQDKYRQNLKKTNYLLGYAGPSRLGARFRRMMEPVFGGIGGQLAGGSPTNQQYLDATGVDPTGRGDLDTANDNKDIRKKLIRERRRNRFGLAATKGVSGIQKVYSTARGLGSYLNSPGFDPNLENPDGTRGGYVDVGAQRQAEFDKMQNRREQQNTFRGRTAARLSYLRGINRINRSGSTKFGSASNKFGTSGAGRFGTAAGLGMLSQYAPEEMRGSMALGAMAGQFDPRLGLAVAGVGGALTARGAGKGALSGAVGGAAIGSMFGGVGAIVGGALGALGGAIFGAANKAAYEMDQAKKVGQNAFMSVFAGLTKAAGTAFAENQRMISEGRTFAPGARGALQDLGSQAAARLRRLARVVGVAGKKVDPAAAGQEAIKLAAIDGGKDSTGKTMTDVERTKKFEAVRSGVVSSNIKNGKDALMEVFQNQKDLGVTISQNELTAGMKNEDTAKKLLDQFFGQGNITKYLDNYQKQTDARAKALSVQLGKTVPEIEGMARAIGYNLYDATKSYEQVLKEFTEGLVQSASQLKDSYVDAFLGLANPFKAANDQEEARLAIDASTRGLSDKLRGGGLDKEGKNKEINTYMEGVFAQILGAAGGDPLLAFDMASQNFAMGTTGGAFAPGKSLEGLGQDFANNPLMASMLADLKKSAISTFGGGVTNNLTAQGFQYGSGGTALMDTLGTIGDPNKLKTALGSLSKISLTDKAGNKLSEESISESVRRALVTAGVNEKDIAKVTTLAATQSKDIDAIYKDVAAAMKAGNKVNGDLQIVLTALNDKMTSNFFTSITDMPDWWRNGLMVDKDGNLKPPPESGDTATPRGGAIGDTTTSRLSQTMNRHSSLNSQVPGNRSITSAWRNTNLGSSNSDHVTGRAYDLVGQNLGKYQTLAREGGGFAEFHGNFAKRHLHVVPGPGATGDTAVPSSRGTANAGAATTVNNYYSFDINGSNMSPDAIAEVVMQKIDRKNKSLRERT